MKNEDDFSTRLRKAKLEAKLLSFIQFQMDNAVNRFACELIPNKSVKIIDTYLLCTFYLN